LFAIAQVTCHLMQIPIGESVAYILKFSDEAVE